MTTLLEQLVKTKDFINNLKAESLDVNGKKIDFFPEIHVPLSSSVFGDLPINLEFHKNIIFLKIDNGEDYCLQIKNLELFLKLLEKTVETQELIQSLEDEDYLSCVQGLREEAKNADRKR